MQKNKTTGKAARPCKSPAAQLQQTGNWIKGKEPVVPLTQLRDERDKVEILAREHALQAALDYYLPCGFRTEKERVESLRKMVFGNWLQAHAFAEKFEPLLGIGR